MKRRQQQQAAAALRSHLSMLVQWQELWWQVRVEQVPVWSTLAAGWSMPGQSLVNILSTLCSTAVVWPCRQQRTRVCC